MISSMRSAVCASVQPLMSPAQDDIATAGGFGTEAETDVEQDIGAADDVDPAAGRLVDAGEDLQQSRLAAAVAAD